MNSVQFVTAVADWLLADPAHIVLAASIVAALTPTPPADSLGGKLYRIVDLLALNVLKAKETGLSAAPTDPAKAKQAGFARPGTAILLLVVGAALALSGCAGVQSAAVAANDQAVQSAMIAGKDQLTLGRELICAVPYQTAINAMADNGGLAAALPDLCPATKTVTVTPAPKN